MQQGTTSGASHLVFGYKVPKTYFTRVICGICSVVHGLYTIKSYKPLAERDARLWRHCPHSPNMGLTGPTNPAMAGDNGLVWRKIYNLMCHRVKLHVQCMLYICRFLKIEVPPNHPLDFRILPYASSNYWGTFHDYGNLRMGEISINGGTQ